MKRATFIAALLLTLTACSHEPTREETEQEYLDFLYKYMPLPDSVSYSEEYWKENVAKTLDVRNLMGWEISEKEFRHFVLPLRVSNETLDDFRTKYADTLCRRIKGMDMTSAALEINHWCHEQATYEASDARTSSPEATMSRGSGRCGEESVLAVAALRAAGIPARQVYTPRWAHTDDNHAWVEVCIDGKWHYMGACEPECELDRAWFTESASRAMLLYTKVFGDYDTEEDIVTRTPCYTEINVIRGYGQARRSTVSVLDREHRSVQGARVDFKIYNYAELHTVASFTSDRHGKASLDMGLGDMVVMASLGDEFGLAKVSGEETEVILNHRIGDSFSLDFDIVPPARKDIESKPSERLAKLNTARLSEEDAIRDSHPHGNSAVTDSFAARHPQFGQELLSTLSSKDMDDVTAEVLEDAAGHVKGQFDPYTDSPRIELEYMRPFFGEILCQLKLSSAEEITAWIKDNITLDDYHNPQGLRMSPVNVWQSLRADRRSRDIFFVALCRCMGIAARYDDIAGVPQYLEGGSWHDVSWDGGQTAEERKGTLNLNFIPSGIPYEKAPKYYTHYTISRINEDGMSLYGNEGQDDNVTATEFRIDEGYYVLTTGRRIIDGSVLAHLEFFNIREDETASVPLKIRNSEHKMPILGTIDVKSKFIPYGSREEVSLLSVTGRGCYILAFMGFEDPSSKYASWKMGTIADVINRWGGKVVIMGAERPRDVLNVINGNDPGHSIRKMVLDNFEVPYFSMPVIVIADGYGRIVWFSWSYNADIADELSQVIARL